VIRRVLLTVVVVGPLALSDVDVPVLSAAEGQFRSRIDLVTMGVTVTDRRGTVLTDLTRDDFELLGFLYRAGFSRSPRLAFVKRLPT